MAWWPVAWSEELAGTPLAVRIGADEIALFRDGAGRVCAVEDRCAHRRVPLSLGKVTANGTLQCGYHGWTFDGATGRCVAIPNLRDDEPISARIKVPTWRVVEHGGVVFVAPQGGAEPAGLAPLAATPGERGESILETGHARWMEALAGAPAAALGLDPAHRILSRAVGALTELSLRDAGGATVSTILVASIPLADQRTLVRWQLSSASRPGWFRRALGRRRAPSITPTLSD